MKMPEKPPLVSSGTPTFAFDILDNKRRYVHWDKLRFLTSPTPFTNEAWWAQIKRSRRQQYKNLPFQDVNGKPFVFFIHR